MNNNLKEKILTLGTKGIAITQIHELYPECSISEIRDVCNSAYSEKVKTRPDIQKLKKYLKHGRQSSKKNSKVNV